VLLEGGFLNFFMIVLLSVFNPLACRVSLSTLPLSLLAMLEKEFAALLDVGGVKKQLELVVCLLDAPNASTNISPSLSLIGDCVLLMETDGYM